MIGIAAAWIFVLLLGGGLALDRTLTNTVTTSFDDQLEYVLTAMISSAEGLPLRPSPRAAHPQRQNPETRTIPMLNNLLTGVGMRVAGDH